MHKLFAAASILVLAACSFSDGDDNNATDRNDQTVARSVDDGNLADTMRSSDYDTESDAETATIEDTEERPIMQAQVVLDRRGFGPGVIDGEMGMSTENALRGFQEANELETSGKMDDPTKEALAEWEDIAATRVVTIPAEWGEIDYEKIPGDAKAKSELDKLGYETLDEKLAERFHTTVAVLKMLNPNGQPAGMEAPAEGDQVAAATPTSSETPESTSSEKPDDKAKDKSEDAPQSFFTAGQQIRVPNIGADRIAPDAISDQGWQQTLAALGVGTEQPEVAKVVVSEKAGTLRAYDADEKLVALFTVTTGSANDPLPLGEWGVNAVGHNPPFSYNPELFWDVPDDNEKLQMPPGPNGPVGVVWIDLTKEHYGIHGTPAPETIGRVQSHGCVRLTNWDAARLAGMVSNSTKVLFEA